MVGECEISFQLAFEQCAIGMALVGTDGKWLRANSSLCEMIGYTEQELLALDIKTITHKDDLKADLEYVRQMLQGTIRTYNMEKRYLRKDDEIIWINLSVSLVRDTNNTPLYFILQIENITERKQAEESLKVGMRQIDDEKNKLESILSAIGDGNNDQAEKKRVFGM
ncbi:MAG: DNA phosphorothioation-dependent restriction protein DptG [ANME-2 cluster archaeon]|nr:DNA phosphorothioation-dependent restriction protein DptG [ANME-2 cluster archaeon]